MTRNFLSSGGLAVGAVLSIGLVVAGCAGTSSAPSAAALDRQAGEMMHTSFRAQGIAGLDRLEQDPVQAACSSDTPPPDATLRALEAEQMKTIRWPSDGRFLGDWKAGEKLAQNGRGMTWTDKSTDPSANGGNCYNCHELDRKEISFGTIGPSLWHYGKLRGVTDPAAPAAQPMLRHAWAKLWNSKATAACSTMPRFGHQKLLDENQLRDLMALLFDPASPVNR